MDTRPVPAARELSVTGAVALYVGALLGPSLLLLPGLAASIAGPASLIDWVALLALSGVFAWVFSRLGRTIRAQGGVSAYVRAAFGPLAARITGACFVAGAVLGVPVVCLIGGSYVADLFGGGRGLTVAAGAGLLVLVVAATLAGAHAGQVLQLALVLLLVCLVVLAVAGSASSMRSGHWTPFAPHGAPSLGRAAGVLMLSFVGWEAVAPMTARLPDPDRQLPRVVGTAFAVTALVDLALAVATVGVLGPHVRAAVALADLMAVAVGPAGPVATSVVAVALTVASTNAYLGGAAALVAPQGGRPARRLQIAVATTGLLALVAVGTGRVTTAELVSVPTALFLVVYLGCMLAASRLLTGAVRRAAALACPALVVVLAFDGWALLVPLAVVLGVAAFTATRAAHSTDCAASSICPTPAR